MLGTKELKVPIKNIKQLKSMLPKTVQQTIPFLDMRKDGICMVKNDYYTKTLQFNDINYELAGDEEQEAIFNRYCRFLNQFESNIDIQFTFQNKVIDLKEFRKQIKLPEKKGESDKIKEYRQEYQEMLYSQFEKRSSGTVKVKYLTFGVHEKNFRKAKASLEREELKIIRIFKRMNVNVHSLNGFERLKLLKESLHPLHPIPFNFDWKSRYTSGISVKDSIAPTSMDFSKLNCFRIGNTYGAAYHVYIDSAEVSDRIIEEIMAVDSNLTVNIHTHSLDQLKALNFVSNKLTNANAVKIGKQHKAADQGHDGDILPPELVNEIDAVNNIYDSLSRRNNRFFITTLLITSYAKKSDELLGIEKDIQSIVQKYHCELKSLDDLQEEGAMSSLPIGINKVKINRSFTTVELATFMPFTTQEVFTPNATYYGFNPLSNSMITLDRNNLINYGALILGMSGTGKSFTAKREIVDKYFRTNDNIIICDPQAEYITLTKELGGTVIEISATSKHHLNPFDINLRSYEKGDDPVAIKSQFILSMCEAAIGNLEAAEKSIIDRCIRKIYQKYLDDPNPENIPVFKDLYNALRSVENNLHAQDVADALEIFVTGSLSVFNHRTNVDVNNRILCFDIRKLSEHLHKMGILVIVDYVWNKISNSRDKNLSTWFYVDEFHLLLNDPLTAAYSTKMWKELRKWSGKPTGITQNVTDVLLSHQVENILKNSAFIVLLGQAAGDREILAERLGISPQQMEYITDTGVGEGLIYYIDKHQHGTIIPFKDSFPTDTKIYQIISTSFEECSDF